MVLLLVAACNVQGPDVQLPSRSLPSEGGFAYQGLLRNTAGCIWLDNGPVGLNLLWPQGYRFRAEGATVTSERGEEIARIGDAVSLDGSPMDHALVLPGCAVRRGVAIVQVMVVNGVRVGPTDNVPPRDPRPVQ